MSILIVDDQPDNVFLVRKILEKAGFQQLFTADCAQKAFDLLESGENVPPRQIELILMDIMMPQMNGIEACASLKKKENFKDIPIIMMTALTDESYLREAFEVGAVDYVTKPLRPIELLSRLRSTLRLKQEMDSRKKREQELQVRNQELEKAVDEIKTLRGFLPICCYCKKIRDVRGYWQQLEAYMAQHSSIVFSHGICESCMKSHHPEFIKDTRKEESKHEAA